jgi:hypothetical protein
MTRRYGVAIAMLAMSIFSSATRASAQRFGDWTWALRSLPSDPAALGMPGRAFLEYSKSDVVDWLATAGLGIGRGVLRASFGQAPYQQIFGVGYSSPIAAQSLGPFGTLAAGVDLTAGYDRSRLQIYDSRAVRLSVPLSIRWGSPSRLSFTPYVAPYAELGYGRTVHANCDEFTCTGPVTEFVGRSRAGGLATGFQLTAWRIGFEGNLRDAAVRPDAMHNSYQWTFGLRLHF